MVPVVTHLDARSSALANGVDDGLAGIEELYFEPPLVAELEEFASLAYANALPSPIPQTLLTSLQKTTDKNVRQSLERLLIAGILHSPSYLPSVLGRLNLSMDNFPSTSQRQTILIDPLVTTVVIAACRYWQHGMPYRSDVFALEPTFEEHGFTQPQVIAELDAWKEAWQRIFIGTDDLNVPETEGENEDDLKFKGILRERNESAFLHLTQLLVSLQTNEQMKSASEKLLQLSKSAIPMKDRIKKMRQIIADLPDESNNRQITLTDAASQMVQGLMEVAQGLKPPQVTFSTGIQCLDSALSGGLRGSELYIIAARPSMGKTALAAQILESVCSDGERQGMFFSLEMNDAQISLRTIARITGIDANRIRSGDLDMEEWEKLQYAGEQMKSMRILLRNDCNTDHICAEVRRQHSMGMCDIVVIDYLQLMEHSNSRSGNRSEDIGYTSRQLKKLSMELNIPIIVLSQLNRNLESRANRRPMLSDLRESGTIEQDADVVMFIYRDEMYNEDTDVKGMAEIIIAKQRAGALSTVMTQYDGPTTKFSSYQFASV